MSPFLDGHFPNGIESTTDLDVIIRQRFSSVAKVKHVQPLPSRLHTVCLLVLSDDQRLLLKCSPRPTTPLLRREQSLLETEARVIALLQKSKVLLIPNLIHYGHPRLPNSSFMIRHYVPGRTREEMETLLSPQTQENIDRQLGILMNEVGLHVSTSFGTFEQVERGLGKRSWREAFVTFVEGALRDAEDVFVNLPYTDIRLQIYRLSSELEEITAPRLVIVDLGQPSQVILNPISRAISGVVDFSNALWGDVHMAEIFDDPPPAFLDGFGSSSSKSQSAMIRQLLYVNHMLLEGR